MANIEIVYKGQTFLKVRPTDNTKMIQKAEKELELLAEQYAYLFANISEKQIKKESVSKEKLKRLQDLKKEITDLRFACELDKVDKNGMDHFWRMDFGKKLYTLTSIPNSKKDVITMNMFPSLDEVFKEYKSLESISKEKFIGKKHQTFNGKMIYVLYEYDEGYLGIVINNDNIPLGPAIGFKTDNITLKYIDENIPGLDGMDYFYDYVYRLKRGI